MTNKLSLIVIMPVYNEQDAIAAVLEKWVSVLSSIPFEHGWQIHVYDDGSKDHTAGILTVCAERYPGKIIVHEKSNSGHGPTVLQGYRENTPKAEWLFQVDSDDEMGPEEFPVLWNHHRDFDFLAGNRKGRKQNCSRKIITLVSRTCIRLLYGKTIRDVNVPYRLMKTKVFSDIYNMIPYNTFAPNVIIAGLAAKQKIPFFEMDVRQQERKTGTVSIKSWKLWKSAAKAFFQTCRMALANHHSTSRNDL